MLVEGIIVGVMVALLGIVAVMGDRRSDRIERDMKENFEDAERRTDHIEVDTKAALAEIRGTCIRHMDNIVDQGKSLVALEVTCNHIEKMVSELRHPVVFEGEK